MKGYLENLRPFERRLVVVVGAVLFVVLNLLFVVPHFSDRSILQRQRARARTKLAEYNAKIAQTSDIDAKIKRLQSDDLNVPAEDQLTHFSTAIQLQQAESAVNIISSGRITTKTNQFFLEQTQTISVQSKEPQLVDFLFKLGKGTSLIRVRDLVLRPEPSHQQLSAQIKLVASYQKKAPVRGAATQTAAPKASAPTLPGSTAKPGTAPSKPGSVTKQTSPAPKPTTSNAKKS